MRTEEAILFLVVTVLSFALVATVVAPLLRKKRGGPVPGPFDALVALRAGDGPRCSTCHQALLPGFRFCPFDGTPLGPPVSHGEAPPATGAADRGDASPGGVSASDVSPGIPRKICPRCARAYRQDTSVCAHDGIPLVQVN